MQPYEFIPGTVQLVQQPNGDYIPKAAAGGYTSTIYNQTSDYIDPSDNERYIVWDADGPEDEPVEQKDFEGAQYTRQSEVAVNFVIKRGGKIRNTVRTAY